MLNLGADNIPELTPNPNPNASAYTGLTFCFLYTLGSAAGAIFGGYLVRTTGNPRGVFALGNLIFAVWIFVYWRFRVWCDDTPNAGSGDNRTNVQLAAAAAGNLPADGSMDMAAVLSGDWFWTLAWVGHFGVFGAVAGASGMIAYISKGYNMSNNPRTGSVWGYWFFQLVTLQFCAFLLRTLLDTTGSNYWIMIGALLTVVAGVVFMTQMPMAAPPQAYMEEVGIEAAIMVNFRTLALFIAAAGFFTIG